MELYERKTYSELWKICQPEGKLYWNARICRNISMPFTLMFLRFGVSANAVSFLRWFVAVFGIFFIALGGYWPTVVGVLIFHFAIILDYSDGAIFRYHTWKNKGRKASIIQGSFLDKIFDGSYRPMLLLAAGIGAFNTFGSPIYLIIGGMGAALIAFDAQIKLRTVDILVYKKQIKLVTEAKESLNPNDGGSLRDIVMESLRMNNPLTLFFWFAIFGYLHAFLLAYVLFLCFYVFLTFRMEWRKICEYDKIILEELYGKNQKRKRGRKR